MYDSVGVRMIKDGKRDMINEFAVVETVGMQQSRKQILDGGNVLFIGALDASKAIASGDIFRINANNLTIELK